MINEQFWTILAVLGGGFGFIIMWLRSISAAIHDIDKHVTIIETILSMMGAPVKIREKKLDCE